MSKINELHAAVQAAREAWVAEIKSLIPIGSVVKVFIGRAPVELEVSGYSARNYSEGYVYGVNTKTGARRHCHFHQIIGYSFSEYDEFGSLFGTYAEKKRAAAKEGAKP